MSLRSVSLIFGAAWLAVVPPAPGQSTKPAAKQAYAPPRTVDGRPRLGGFWANNNATPVERPAALAGRELLTDAELEAMKKKAAELFNGEGDAAFGDDVFNSVLDNVLGKRNGFRTAGGSTGDYSSVWTVERVWDNRTSLITDPPDGRMPAMNAEGLARRQAQLERTRRIPTGPEDRSLSERCVTYYAPQITAGYQSYYQIVQSANAVVLMTEMIHDARVIPIGDSRPRLPGSVQFWKGDSRGRWEGDTLVVDTTNFKPGAFLRGASSDKLQVTERFTRTGAETLKYEVTIDDPGTWTKPWSLMIPWQSSSKPIYEYACHEGNYSMTDILKGARAEERASSSGLK